MSGCENILYARFQPTETIFRPFFWERVKLVSFPLKKLINSIHLIH